MQYMTPLLARQLGTLVENLAGHQGEQWGRAFERFIEKDDPWDTRLLVVRPWRTVTIGKYKTPGAYLEAFGAAGRYVEPRFARAMVENTPLLQEETEVELFKFTTQELALGGCTFYPHVCERMPKFGLTYCPAEVALALAAEKDAHGVKVVMKGVPVANGKLGFFMVEWNEGKNVLDSSPVTTMSNYLGGGLLGASCQFVFTEDKALS